MARPSTSAPIDYSKPYTLTHGLLARAACPAGAAFVLLKDAEKKGLRLRVTQAGGKHWQFEARVKGRLFSRTLGEWPAVSIEEAKAEAHRLRGLTEKGIDPREIEREETEARAKAEAARVAQEAAKAAAEVRQALTVADIWAVYLEARRPYWGATHYNDHIKLARAGGEPVKRGKGLTVAMPLHPLMSLRLAELDAPTIEAWAAEQAKTRPTSARLAWRLLKVFLNWCAEQSEYAPLVGPKNAAATSKTRETLGKPQVKTDVLLREQLPAWFAAVRSLQNPTIAAVLQVMLLTGARPGEVLEIRWEDINERWKGLTIRDKVEGERVIPLTPYVAHLLTGLPRRNEWVFASTRTVSLEPGNIRRRERRAENKGEALAEGEVVQASASGRITEPRNQHVAACRVAGIEGLTLHGLRRSFKSLTEWLEIPAGVVAQLQGHKPSATAEKHYTVRPLDLLRVHHERIEAWILEQAGIEVQSEQRQHGLRVARQKT